MTMRTLAVMMLALGATVSAQHEGHQMAPARPAPAAEAPAPRPPQTPGFHRFKVGSFTVTTVP